MHKSSRSGLGSSSRYCEPVRSADLLAMICLGLSFVIATGPPLFSQSASPSAQTAPSTALTSTRSFDLSDEVVHDVLTNLQRGLEAHSIDRVLSIFDADTMKDYPRFRDQMVAFFRLHDSIKFRYQFLQVTENKDVGSATADVEMDADPTDILPAERRRTTQMRFQLKRVGTGWKVTDLSPMDFFTQ